jgi:hypothetical protein
MLGNIQFSLHKGTVDDELRTLVRKARPLPCRDLLFHRLEVPLHSVDSDREGVHEIDMLSVLGEHRREHARDNVPKLNISKSSQSSEAKTTTQSRRSVDSKNSVDSGI